MLLKKILYKCFPKTVKMCQKDAIERVEELRSSFNEFKKNHNCFIDPEDAQMEDFEESELYHHEMW